ncbi:CopG family transcriptional regulator [Caulobacter sp.]|jgi:predicted transcriptional regulator|uniref:CopG family transcriptional regulator n=1 Tax=Caulobacter sp. TaxID=78 RepID=UPI0031D0811B
MKLEPTDLRDGDNAAEKAADTQGLADLDAGRVVSGEAVKRWLRSWGTAERPPTPRTGD